MKKVVVFVSAPDASVMRTVIVESGKGRLGNYSSTVSHTHTGFSGAMRLVDEERIEFACDDDTFADIVSAIDSISPNTSVDSWNLDTYSR